MSVVYGEEDVISRNIIPIEEVAAQNTIGVGAANDKGECTSSIYQNQYEKQDKQGIKIEPSPQIIQSSVPYTGISPNETSKEESVAVEALYELGSRKSSTENIVSEQEIIEKQEMSCQPVITSSFRLLQCGICSSCFSSQSDLELHQEVCDGHTYSCTKCDITFNTKDKLDNHAVCHEVSRPFSCRLCGSLFKMKKQLQSHTCLQKLMGLVCSVCGAEFSKLSSLNNHIKIHSYPPGRDFVVPNFCETVLSDNSGWAHDIQTLPPLMPQLDIQNSRDIPNWNENLNLNDSLENKDLHDSIDIAQEMTINTSYSSILDAHSAFHNDFDNMDDVSVHSDSLELKQQVEIYSHTDLDANQRGSHTSSHIPNTVVEISNFELKDEVKKKPHTCKYCGVSFTREKALISHERFHQDYLTDILECKKCGGVFLNKEDLKVHPCSKPLQKAYVVQYQSDVQPEPTRNIAETSSGDPLENRRYEQDNKKYSREHYTTRDDSPTTNLKLSKHTCEHCFKRFTTKQKKFRHMWIHRNKTFSCEVCSNTFSTQKQLNEHRLSTHEGNTPHGCEICGKCFASRQGLWEHMRLHKEGSAPHQCNLCGKKFTSRQGYHIHARTHTGERPYGCRYCWKAFRDGGTLRKHERIHTGERPHVCPICHRAFNQKVVLREHVRWLHAHHHPDHNQPFIPCPIPGCQHTLTDKEDLCAHIVKHSDTQPQSHVDRAKTAQVKIKPKPLAKLIKHDVFPKQDDVMCDENFYGYDGDTCAESPDHRCEMCGETFPVRELLLSHIKIHI